MPKRHDATALAPRSAAVVGAWRRRRPMAHHRIDHVVRRPGRDRSTAGQSSSASWCATGHAARTGRRRGR
ncbi:hypothetical protein [Acinetobacter baumannii]|uniref:hypothetical protein n=1 Tax=Acinetobacter baumannii TaxID=470 RepID=UPI002B1CBD8A|nr:hypothetical protein [Acinetobacter baumannii]